MTYKYKSRAGSSLTDQQVEIIGDELEKIAVEDRTTDTVWRIAQDPGNPLHPFIDWDPDRNRIRGEKQQIRELISQVYVTYERLPSKSVTIRGFHSVAYGKRRVFVTPAEMSQDTTTQEDVRQQILDDLMSFHRRYQRFLEFLGEEDALHDVDDLLVDRQLVPARP